MERCASVGRLVPGRPRRAARSGRSPAARPRADAAYRPPARAGRIDLVRPGDAVVGGAKDIPFAREGKEGPVPQTVEIEERARPGEEEHVPVLPVGRLVDCGPLQVGDGDEMQRGQGDRVAHIDHETGEGTARPVRAAVGGLPELEVAEDVSVQRVGEEDLADPEEPRLIGDAVQRQPGGAAVGRAPDPGLAGHVPLRRAPPELLEGIAPERSPQYPGLAAIGRGQHLPGVADRREVGTGDPLDVIKYRAGGVRDRAPGGSAVVGAEDPGRRPDSQKLPRPDDEHVAQVGREGRLVLHEPPAHTAVGRLHDGAAITDGIAGRVVLEAGAAQSVPLRPRMGPGELVLRSLDGNGGDKGEQEPKRPEPAS